MNLISGEDGALSAEIQQNLLPSGMLIIDTDSTDECNRPVLIIDRGAASPEILKVLGQRNVRAQLGFFAIQVLSESRAALQNGFVKLYFMEEPSREDKSWQHYSHQEHGAEAPMKHRGTADAMRILASPATLVKCRSLHFMAPWKQAILGKLSNVYLAIAEAFLGFRFRFHCIKTTKDTSKETLNMLEPFGIKEKNLPPRYGGTADGKRWYHQRVTLERERYNRRRLRRNQQQEEQKSDPSSSAQQEEVVGEEERQMAQSLKIKRVLEDVHEYNRISMERRKRVRLEKAAVDVREENESLRRQNAFLKKKLGFVQRLVEYHEQDRTKILQVILNELQANTTFPPEARIASGEPIAAAERIVSKFLEFNGRDADTGEWQFGIPPGLTPDEQRISLDLASGLQRSQTASRRQVNATMPPLSLLEECTTEDDGTLDQTIERLAEYANTLKKENERLISDRSFLTLCGSVTEYSVSAYDEYLNDNLEPLSQLYAAVFKFLTGKDSEEYLQGETSPQAVAKRVLEKFVCWDGVQFYGPAVMEQYLVGDRKSAIHMVVKTLYPHDLEGFRQILLLHTKAGRDPVAQCLEWYSDAPLFVKIAGHLVLFTPPTAQQVEAHQKELLRQAQTVLENEAKRVRMEAQEKQFEESRRKYRSERKKLLKRL